jgi:hypothetical protein
MKMGQPETPTQSDWLQQNLENGSVVGVDPFLCPIAQWNDLKRGLEKSGHRLVRISPFDAEAMRHTSIISSDYNRIITIDPYDTTAVVVNVTAKNS